MFMMLIYGFENYPAIRVLCIVLGVCVLLLQVPHWYHMISARRPPRR